uniref:SFRICE_005771 n=1 Tax=Spodoptera frugiperda TaxID=7108 RepID=A0A2H1V4N0_SPOFR
MYISSTYCKKSLCDISTILRQTVRRLYLPAPYVLPGGEGSGPWGDWGEISPCSRTCGGGVASQKRTCLESEPQTSCTGGDTKYFSCQTQACPAGSGDFRAEQCAEFNDKEFRGYKYNWEPFTKTPNPCELTCRPSGERFYYRHKLHVVDGTRCNDDSFDVCVNGVCQHVGCDMMLGSNAKEDKCRQCRGNGTSCYTTEGLLDSQDLIEGYNDILLVPEGSTNIIIEEVKPSNNYLALRNKHGRYYLNDNYKMDFPGRIMVPGGFCTYERSWKGLPSPDKLHCLGPITESLYLSLLLQDENVGVKYEFSVPNDFKIPNNLQYEWVREEYTPCSATCGGGFQSRNVTCRSREKLEMVDNNNGTAAIVPDGECLKLLGPKPELTQKCNQDEPCPLWFVGQWKPCDKLCDEGRQIRQVVCHQKINGRVTVLGDGNCTDEKPSVEQKCMIRPCDGVDWVTTDWSECETCISERRTRRVICLTLSHIRVNDSVCSHLPRPVEQEECDRDHRPEAQWHTTEWSKCTVLRGDRVHIRKVFCGVYNNVYSIEQVEDSNCAHLLKCNDTKPCPEAEEEYPLQWFSGPWSSCTKDCGGGEQYRRVLCMRGFEEAFECPWLNIMPDSMQLCNTEPCDPEIINSKNSSSLDENKLPCNETKFGCCPDNTTASLGPFDKGCSNPRTCKESTYGCCPDGVSPKLGDTDEGCPVEACADTLFGCCFSDKTAAQGDGQVGCPETSTTGADTETTTEDLETSASETTPGAGTTEVGSITQELCSGFEFGCCADNQTEAKGPNGLGCPCNANTVKTPANIAGDENAVVTGELGSPLSVRCLANGCPPPLVLWYKGYDILKELYNDDVYEARSNEFIIRNLTMDTLGQYTCQAYNGVGKAALWVVNVRANRPEGLFTENTLLVPGETLPTGRKIQVTITAEYTETRIPVFTESSISEANTTEGTTIASVGALETSKGITPGVDSVEVRSITLDLCSSFEFGCCADNQTEAKGPGGQGCPSPCNATEPCDFFKGIPMPPKASLQPELEVAVESPEGGKATLQCLFQDIPPPKITWRHEKQKINRSTGRYRLMSDGTLEIVSLHRNDTGLYICEADNGLRVAKQEIHLVVNDQCFSNWVLLDPIRMPVGIAGDENAVVTGELGSPLSLRCLAYGYPPPSVFWYLDKGFEEIMVPFNNAEFESRGNVLLIRNLTTDTLGQYKCQAYNGEGKAASWVVDVRAYRSEGLSTVNEILVPRTTLEVTTTAELTTTIPTSETHSTVVTKRLIPDKCKDNPFFANCDLIVRSKICSHKYYGHFCCKSCMEAGLLDPK